MPELIFIAIIALIVLGPQRLPGVMREVAKFIAQIRGLTSELTSQFSEEIAMLEELDPRKLIDEATQPIKDAVEPLNDTKSKKPKATQSKAKTAAKSSADASSNVATDDSSKTESEDADSPAADDDDSKTVDGNKADKTEADKPKAQTQTDPSNVASTDPYTNRTPNKNLIKRPEKKEKSDAESDAVQAEENQIAPPQMQEKIAQDAASSATDKSAANSTQKTGSTAGNLLAGKQAYSNGDSVNKAKAETEKPEDESTLSDSSTIA